MHRDDNRSGQAVTAEKEKVCSSCGHTFAHKDGEVIKSRLISALAGIACLLLAGGMLLALLIAAQKRFFPKTPPKTEPTSAALHALSLPEFVYPGDELTLVPEFYPEGSEPSGLSWSSSDESIASVDETGLVQVKGPGEAMITAVTDGGVSCSFAVRACVRPEYVAFGKNEEAVKVGESFTPDVTVLPYDASYGEIVYEYDEDMLTMRDDGSFSARRNGRSSVTARVGDGLSATLEVFAYRHEAEMLNDLIMRKGERDLESQCFYYALDQSEMNEDGYNIVKYVELIYFPDSEITKLCCDIYDVGLNLYYETNVIFILGNKQLASVTFACSLEAASGSHTVPLSAQPTIYAEGRIGIGEYNVGDPVSTYYYQGSDGFRENAEMIMRSMVGYSVTVLKQSWPDLGIPFTVRETLGFPED